MKIIEYLRHQLDYASFTNNTNSWISNEVIVKCIESLTKQNPEKVMILEEPDGLVRFICPSCKNVIGRSGDYCKYCGQRLER